MNNRKELKFLCDDRMLASIENRIKGVMHKDLHQTGSCYNIRSIYFDSYDNKCYRENAAGIDRRNKYRIRIYDHSDSVIKAEIKTKYRDTTSKQSATLSKDQFYAIMNHKSLEEILGDDPNRALLNFAEKIVGEGFRPASIVEYERSAYIFNPCNVRVTFDRNIAASEAYGDFFSRDMQALPVLECGAHILEVKYDEFLPEFLGDLIGIGELRRTSFSKYFESRQTLGIHL